MANKRGGLLAQIEADIGDDRVPLSSLLQQCVVLGARTGSEKMRDWARWELNGYVGEDTVPDYRHFHAAVMAVITNNAGYNAITQRIHEDVFSDQVRDLIRETVGDIEDAILPQGIGMLEGLASQGTDMHRLGPPWSSVMADTLNQFNMPPNSRVREVYWSVSNASIRGVLVRVRAALVELVAELITLTPQDQDVPDKQAADQAVQFIVTGDRATIHYNNRPAGDIVTHSPGEQYNFGDVTGNVAVGSSDVTQNYGAGFDITKVREFADLSHRDRRIAQPRTRPASPALRRRLRASRGCRRPQGRPRSHAPCCGRSDGLSQARQRHRAQERSDHRWQSGWQ